MPDCMYEYAFRLVIDSIKKSILPGSNTIFVTRPFQFLAAHGMRLSSKCIDPPGNPLKFLARQFLEASFC